VCVQSVARSALYALEVIIIYANKKVLVVFYLCFRVLWSFLFIVVVVVVVVYCMT